MNDTIQVPEDLRPAFEQILKIAPDSYKEDAQFQQSLLLYLKLGGVRLARQYLEVCTKPFCEEFDLIRKRAEGLTEEDSDTSGDATANDAEDEDEDEDDDDDETDDDETED